MPQLLPRITDVAWIDPQAVRVRFSSPLDNQLYQLYAGRRLIGETETTEEREIVGQLVAAVIPEHLAVLAIDPADLGVDYGELLPPRPYARTLLEIDTTDWPTDVQWIDILAGTEPDGAVDADNRIGRINFEAAGVYAWISPPQRTGTWNYRVVGRDNRPDNGNVGTATDLAVDVLAYPAPLASGPNVAIEDGTATVTWTWGT